MLNEIRATVVGNLTADPELTFTPSGVAVARFTVASTPRVKRGDAWEDGEPSFVPCELWRQPAENFAESASKGARVVAIGTFRTDRWKDKESGEDRSRMKLTVDEIGLSTTYATATVRKVSRNAGPDPVDPFSGEAATSRVRPDQASADA